MFKVYTTCQNTDATRWTRDHEIPFLTNTRIFFWNSWYMTFKKIIIVTTFVKTHAQQVSKKKNYFFNGFCRRSTCGILKDTRCFCRLSIAAN